MNRFLVLLFLFGTIMIGVLVGCSDTTNKSVSVIPAYDPNHPKEVAQETESQKNKVIQAIKTVREGLDKVQYSVNNGDFVKASETVNPLRESFHGVIHPMIQSKKGQQASNYAHETFSSLETAIDRKDASQILDLLDKNREMLDQARKLVD